jgi:hypothetical protein
MLTIQGQTCSKTTYGWKSGLELQMTSDLSQNNVRNTLDKSLRILHDPIWKEGTWNEQI